VYKHIIELVQFARRLLIVEGEREERTTVRDAAAEPRHGVRAQGSGFRFKGSGFRVQGLGFRV
jgi:hypothetical protein